MKLSIEIFHNFLLSILFYQATAQEVSRTSGTGNNAGNSNQQTGTSSALAQLRNVATIDDFINLLTVNGRRATQSDIFSEFESENRQLVMAGGGRLATPDECSSRNTSVNLQIRSQDSSTIFFPKCTRVERCGGCTSSRHLACVPNYIERVSVNVVKARVPYPGSSFMVYTGFESVILERHISCHVQCNLTRELCGPNKRFLQHQCDCACINHVRCDIDKVWDPETCSCQCAERQQCCCGLVFDEDTCRCRVNHNRMGVSANRTGAAPGQAAYNPPQHSNTGLIGVVRNPGGRAPPTPSRARPNNPAVTSSSSTPRTTTTTTATTTTTRGSTMSTTSSATSTNPCANTTCPRGWVARRVGQGCTCRRGSGGQRRPSRRRGRHNRRPA